MGSASRRRRPIKLKGGSDLSAAAATSALTPAVHLFRGAIAG